MKLCYTDRAKVDLELAFEWYERQQKGLGFEFLDCIENAVKAILENHEMYQFYYSVFRGCVVRRFHLPYFTPWKVMRLSYTLFLTIGKTRKKGRATRVTGV